MQIWYLSPFLLGVLVWWVHTRRHPEDKERWTLVALGVCGGAVLMFVLIYISQMVASKTANPRKLAEDGPALVAELAPKVTLDDDHSVEILPPLRIRQDSSVAVGSFQITLVAVWAGIAVLQIEPYQEIDFFGARPTEWKDKFAGTRKVFFIRLGEHAVFGYQGRLYKLGLLEIQSPLWGFVPSGPSGIWPSHAVIRIVKMGFYDVNYRIPPIGAGPTGGPPAEKPKARVNVGNP